MRGLVNQKIRLDRRIISSQARYRCTRQLLSDSNIKKHVLTVTTDNDIEFRNHKDIAKALDCTVYFADPYCSGQKGAIENMNKILREFFPKGTDFRLVSQALLNDVQYQINDRPRKKLGFSNPKIEFFKRIY
ncbi:MAG: IS30 family transposase [Muribaculaceae bacterium]